MQQDKPKHPKRPRIGYFSYKGYYSYFITICTDSKKHVFVSGTVVDLVLSLLKEISSQFNFHVYTYCFMPDHLHILIVAEDENADLKSFLKMFKQKSGYYYKKEYGQKLWQPSFYDHVLRKKESLNKIAEYILLNPIRKGLVEDYKDYPYLGSLMFDM